MIETHIETVTYNKIESTEEIVTGVENESLNEKVTEEKSESTYRIVSDRRNESKILKVTDEESVFFINML